MRYESFNFNTYNPESRNRKTAIKKLNYKVGAQLVFVTNLHCKLFQGTGNYSSQVQFVFTFVTLVRAASSISPQKLINHRETKLLKKRNELLMQKGRCAPRQSTDTEDLVQIMEVQSSLFFVHVALSSSRNVYQVRTVLQTTVESFNTVFIPCSIPSSFDPKNGLLTR